MFESLRIIKDHYVFKFGLRKVYTIAFPCDQTIEYWTGTTYPQEAVRYTFLGRKAWRTGSKDKAYKAANMLEMVLGIPGPMVGEPVWEFLLNREDWTW